MGRVAEKHPRYRTKDEIVRDIAFVLTSPLTYGSKWAVLKDACWVWTEFHGKYKGCPYWTRMALAEHQLNPKAKFRHEHAVPKSLVIELLFAQPSPTVETVREICERLLIGVVVTQAEDDVLNAEYGRTMPPEFFDPGSPGYRDPWLRYKRYNIDVVAAAP